MATITLKGGLQLSRIVHGHWRLNEWNLSDKQLLSFIIELIENGITSFDHADIYGNYSCEAKLGDALQHTPSIRSQIQLITKCGINLISDKFPDRRVKFYDYSYDHIVHSVNTSLHHFRTDYIDLLLLHRPSPYLNPEEVARAFSQLKKEGKVLHFGVSNFNQQQFETLNSFTEDPLVTNQVEISPYCLDHFENGNIDFFLKVNIRPMAWSPLAGGALFNFANEKSKRLIPVLEEITRQLNIPSVETTVHTWLLQHPAKIIPIVGSGKMERIQQAINAQNIVMSTEQWFSIYIAAAGIEMP